MNQGEWVSGWVSKRVFVWLYASWVNLLYCFTCLYVCSFASTIYLKIIGSAMRETVFPCFIANKIYTIYMCDVCVCSFCPAFFLFHFLFLIVIEMGNFLKCPCCTLHTSTYTPTNKHNETHLHLSHTHQKPWKDFWCRCHEEIFTFMSAWGIDGHIWWRHTLGWLLNHIISVDYYVPPWLNCGFIHVCIHLFHSGILIRTFGSKVWVCDVYVFVHYASHPFVNTLPIY